MDIKPRNILAKASPGDRFGWRVYLADFVTSRAFAPSDHNQTESAVGMTRIYCAPEVASFEKWGRAADVFSLGPE
jgi:serine/threonine protein kinase